MKCSFCGKQIPKGTGLMYVQKTGKRYYFCSSKCEKNLLELNRKPLTTKWTSAHSKKKEKEKPQKKRVSK